VTKLVDLGWRLEEPYPHADEDKAAALRPGAFDAWLDLAQYGAPPFVAEWETGNISPSHRALNKARWRWDYWTAVSLAAC
jgi:hypothetical protein